MKCKKCGANITKGNLYCSLCGNEVQLVPDYNFLEDDMLSDIIQNGTADTQKISNKLKKNNRKSKKSIYVWSGITIVMAVAIVTLLFISHDISNKQKNSYEYQFQKGNEFLSQKDYEKAIAYYKRALELRPNDRASREQLVEIHLSLNKETDAVTILKELLRENHKDKESCQKLIEIYEKNQQYENIVNLHKELAQDEMDELFKEYIVEKPFFSIESDTYSQSIDISIYSKNGQTIFYTTDGSDPIKNGRTYTDSIFLSKEGTTVIQAVAQNEKGLYSEVVKATYTIKFRPPAMPRVTPISGTYEVPQMITVEVPEGQTAYYTWDGTDPTEASEKYTTPLEMPQGNQVLSVILVDSHGLKSNVYRVNYVYMP